MWASLGHSEHEAHHFSHGFELGLMGLSVALAPAAMVLVYFLYKRHMDKTAEVAKGFGGLYEASLHKYWVDEIYEYAVIEPIKRISYFFLFRIVDATIIDGAVNGAGRLTKWLSEKGKLLQTGVAGTYALWVLLGLLAILAYFFGAR
jgi:NADH-quinone oxidoreductase subunit L